MRRRKSHRRNRGPVRVERSAWLRQRLDRVLDAAQEDPAGAVEAVTKLGQGVVEGVRMVGKAVQSNPEKFREALRDEAVRAAAKLIKERR